jgi:hypothetical protein
MKIANSDFLTKSMNQRFSWEANRSFDFQELPSYFMKPEGSSTRSHQTTYSPYHEADAFFLRPDISPTPFPRISSAYVPTLGYVAAQFVGRCFPPFNI